jgi:hypothetical protein
MTTVFTDAVKCAKESGHYRGPGPVICAGREVQMTN